MDDDEKNDRYVSVREFLGLEGKLNLISQQIATLNDSVNNRVAPLERTTQEHDKRLDDVEKKVWALFGIGATIGIAVIGLAFKWLETLF